jgi:hypothetical protein
MLPLELSMPPSASRVDQPSVSRCETPASSTGRTRRSSHRGAEGSRLTRFQVEIREGRERRVRASRRAKIVELLDEWIPCRIESADYSESRVTLTVAFCRPVTVAAAEQFARELPGYVRKSFRAVDASSSAA